MESASIALRSSGVALVLMLAACADRHWDKSGVDAATLDEDLQQCTQRARLDARQQELPSFGAPLAIRTDPQGNPVVVPSTTRDTDRFLREQDSTGVCMRRKGYALVPAREAVTSDKRSGDPHR